MEKTTYKRLESLDALRGFDLFFLVALGPLAHSLAPQQISLAHHTEYPQQQDAFS